MGHEITSSCVQGVCVCVERFISSVHKGSLGFAQGRPRLKIWTPHKQGAASEILILALISANPPSQTIPPLPGLSLLLVCCALWFLQPNRLGKKENSLNIIRHSIVIKIRVTSTLALMLQTSMKSDSGNRAPFLFWLALCWPDARIQEAQYLIYLLHLSKGNSFSQNWRSFLVI